MPMEEDNGEFMQSSIIHFVNEHNCSKRSWNPEEMLVDSEISGDHEWTEIHDYYYYDDGEVRISNSHRKIGKRRECMKCGLKQRYGHHWGSKKKGGFEPVIIACEGRPSKKVHQELDDDDYIGDHKFGPHYSVHDGQGGSHHERKCKVCGIRQRYGTKYGSKRTPHYERVDPRCGDTLHI